MVAEDFLTFELKLKNIIKHSVCRKVIKVLSISINDQEETVVLLKTPEHKQGVEITIPKKYNVKDSVCYVMHSPYLNTYSSLQICKVSNMQKTILKSFSNQTLPDSFSICKIPKKQIQVDVGGKKDYVNISLQSYQKLLSIVDRIKLWPAVIDCKKLEECVSRRELVTILLQVSQLLS